MIGNSNINWIGGNVDTYITVRVQEEDVTNFYFTASLLEHINKKTNRFLDRNNEEDRCHIMIGFDKDENCLLFGVTHEPNVYSSAFSIQKKDGRFKGKPKKMTNDTLYSFIKENSTKDKFKLIDNEITYEKKNNRVLIKSYLDDVLYY